MTSKRKVNPDAVIAVVIYMVSMGIGVLWIMYGQLSEDGRVLYSIYDSYIKMLNTGGFHLINSGLSSSCLTTTLLPAVVQKILHTDPQLTFYTIPYLLYAVIPLSCYWISRRYMGIVLSVLVSFMVLVCFNTMYATLMIKMGMSLGAMSITIWALLEKRITIACIFGIITVLSHYAVGFILIGMLIFVVAASVVWYKRLRDDR